MRLLKKPYRKVTPEFHARTHGARKVLVVDIGGLGDLVHALPALWAIRQAYPQASLHFVARTPFAPLMRTIPWIDRVWAYTGLKQKLHGHDFEMAKLVHAEAYDVSINLMGTNRSCIIGRVSGARFRLGRRPREDDRDGWRWLNTHVMEQPYFTELRYLQKWKCVAQAGIVTAAPEFPFAADAAPRRALGYTEADDGRYLSISPCTSIIQKELTPEQMIDLLRQLHAALPGYRLALSCAAAEREQAVLDAILAGLDFTPWQVHRGTVDVAQLASIVDGAAVQLSGDTGPMHLAWLFRRPSVNWFWGGGDIVEWRPDGAHHRILTQDARPHDYLRDIPTATIVDAVSRLLAARAGRTAHA